MIAVIADDLSGAAEIAGAALRRGLSVEVQTSFNATSRADVICVDIDSRSVAAKTAAGAAGEAARRMREAGAEWVYKKCDSVLRGNVMAEIRAAMGALGLQRTLLVPANPSRGRTVRGGHLFVNGLPLHASDFASDPDHPRSTSSMVELLGSELSGVSAPDAVDESDMVRHAAALGEGTLAAGGADFFEAILGRRGFAPSGGAAAKGDVGSTVTSLVVCGSAAAWGKRRRQAAERGIPTFSLRHGAARIAGSFRSNPCVLIGISDDDVARKVAGPTLIAELARIGARVLRAVPVGHVMIEGGATASALVRELGWTRLLATESSAPSICTFRVLGTTAPILSIKPGSYDWPVSLWR